MARMRSPSLAALVAVIIIASGCGADEGPEVATANGTAPTAGDQANRWAACMQAEGIAMIPNIEGQLVIDKSKTTVEKVAQAAERCRAHAPVADATQQPPTAAELDRLRRYATCMREHGITEYPDPDPVTGRAGADAVLSKRDKYDRDLVAAMQACQSVLGTGTGTVGG
jgi:hypothetical protein